MSVGERLRAARLDTGLTIDEIAAETKIPHWILDAIERDDLSRVPGGVFVRGYLRSFADAIGLQPAEILAAYAHDHPQLPAPLPLPPPSPSPSPDPTEQAGTPKWHFVAIAAVVLGGIVLGRNMSRSDSDTLPGPASPPPVTAPATVTRLRTTEPVAAATTGVGQSGPAMDSIDAGKAPVSGAPLVVEIHVTDDAWIDAVADGERKAYQVFTEGQDLRLEAKDEIRLRVGNAGAVAYTINGRPARSLGGPGIVRDVVISPNAYESLLAADAPSRP